MKRPTLTLIILVVLAFGATRPVRAATRYIDSMFSSVKTTKNVTYGQAPSLGGINSALTLDIYEPEGDTATKRAAIIWVHGGSFVGGSKEQFSQVAPEYAKRGYIAFSINYRLTNHAVNPSSPDIGSMTQYAKHDVLAAVRWVRAHASDYHIDPTRIIVAGFSAGAWSSLYAAYDTENVGTSGTPGVSSAVAAVASFAGGMSPKDTARITKGEPPAIFLHGSQDTIVPIALPKGVYNQLQSLGIPSEFHTFNGGHGAPQNSDAHKKVRNFLVTTLKLNQVSYVADLDGNGVVNVIDFTLLMNYWLWNNLEKIDFNKDGKISVIDYTIFMNSWYDYSKTV